MDWPAGLRDAAVSSFQTLELQVPEVCVTMPGILTGLLRMELGLRVCEAGTFPPELSPQSLKRKRLTVENEQNYI